MTDTILRPMKSRTSTRLLEALEMAFVSGEWRPGQRIPTEREMAEHFGVARNTIRRALQQLEQSGRIVRQVGRGTFVSESEPNRPNDLAHRIQEASPTEIMEVRLMVEPHAAELAAARANGAELKAMADCLSKGEAAATIADFEMWDGLFHQALIVACRNHLLTDIYDAINAVRRKADWTALKERVLTPARRQLTQRQHRAILAALKNRDAAGAAAEMRQHLTDVRRSMIS